MQWLKKNFDAVGLTQYPVGRHFDAVQSQFGGSVVLCLDVSGSMAGARLTQAIQGCQRFVTEAVQAGYHVAGLLWHHAIDGSTELSRDREATDQLFGAATAAGGNNIVPALVHCELILAPRSGDRVIAIFGDGDLGSPTAARTEAQRLSAQGIRVLTCGLGDASAAELGSISTETTGVARVARADTIADAIAGMADGLRRRT